VSEKNVAVKVEAVFWKEKIKERGGPEDESCSFE